MKRPFAALLLVVLGFALIAGLRLAVPHILVGARGTDVEPSRVTGSPAAARDTIAVSEPAFPDVDPLLYAGADHNSTAASENADWMDSAIERGALLGDFGKQPDASGTSGTNPGFARNGGASAPTSFGTDHLWGASGGINPNAMGSPNGGNLSPALSSPVDGGSSTALGVDDLQTLFASPGNGTASELSGDSEIRVAPIETAGAAPPVPISEPPMHLLVVSILSLLSFIRSRSARATLHAS
jgi:hypothetical protein